MDKEELLVKYIGELIVEHKIFYSGSFEKFIQTKFKDNFDMLRFLRIFHYMYRISHNPNPRIPIIIQKTIKYFIHMNTSDINKNALKTVEKHYESSKD